MKKMIYLIALLIGLISQPVFSLENDVSNYPSFFEDQVTLVVGDKSSSINVIAQTQILTSLAGIKIKNKLSSEITDLNQNIISIGNPCINEITAKIMNNPEPCDRNFERGKSYIKLYKSNGFHHMVVAGYTDLGTKKAAEVLADYRNYNLNGDEFALEFSNDNGNRLTEEKKEAPTEKEQEKPITDTKIKSEIKTSIKPEIEIKAEDKTEQKIIENKTKENVELKVGEKKQEEKQDNIIIKFVSWILSIFKK